MIEEVIVYRCQRCESVNIVRNGHSKEGRQRYYCQDCKHHGRLDTAPRYSAEEKEQILATSLERSSLRGLQRIYGVCRDTVITWLKEKVSSFKSLKEMVLPAEKGDAIEVDELWSLTKNKRHKRWIWIAICRRTRQIIAFAIGDRGEEMARRLWRSIPADYREKAVFYSDFRSPYLAVFPEKQHEAVGKETGETAHVERWNNTLRQRVGRFVRKSLSFSKSDKHHFLHLRFFMNHYNSTLSAPI